MAFRFLFGALALFALACGDDGDGPPDCDLTLDEWCQQYDCDGYETRDDALSSLLEPDGYAVLGARTCDDGNTVHVGDALNGRIYGYDPETGELAGVTKYTDMITGAACESEHTRAGTAPPLGTRACEDDVCELLTPWLDASELLACTGEIAQPFIAACLEAAPALIAGCEGCACGACYPVLVQCEALTDPDGGDQACVEQEHVIECLEAHCADECADQLDALQAR